jgi:hypothetical protein
MPLQFHNSEKCHYKSQPTFSYPYIYHILSLIPYAITPVHSSYFYMKKIVVLACMDPKNYSGGGWRQAARRLARAERKRARGGCLGDASNFVLM